MARILVTGSTQGIGLETARQLLTGGHHVVVHARDDSRAAQARAALADASGPAGAPDVVVGDLASTAATRRLALDAAEAGPLDVVVHNAGLGAPEERVVTDDGLERTFQVNVVAPYLLTCLVPPPARLVYLSSGTMRRGRLDLDDLQHEARARSGRFDGMQVYADTKLADLVLALAVARRWPDVVSNAVDPGWIRTRMGGAAATGELVEGADTPVWLATSGDEGATRSGRFVHRRQAEDVPAAATDPALQDDLLAALEDLTGTGLPSR
ncbi:SDR family NAD(P)-dependent oxidoreductase [Aquipuribacter nitratireducens]|uniref:SDR family NAD(P)-dependent oxidoreductase n=1 Tax=Aquipuribacter nitratireducens TaxID=650104 RepID=A0ABW0GN74_9MICO